MNYTPAPIATNSIELPDSILAMTEKIAEHAHEVWARQRIADGWSYGETRNDSRKEHPCLIPYDELSNTEKQYDRNAALETLKVIAALGYRIVPPPTAKGGAAGVAAAEVLLTGLRAAQRISSERSSDEREQLELSELLSVWNQQRDQAAAWRATPHLYEYLGRRFLKLGAAPLAREVARTALELSVPDGPEKTLPLWKEEETVELRQILGLALARTGNPEDAQQILLQLHHDGNVDEETLGMLARTFKDQALQQPAGSDEHGTLLKRSLRYYREAYERSKGIWTGINVATVERLAGDAREAERVARRILAQCETELTEIQNCDAPPQNWYWHLATLGEATLNLGDFEQAADFYRQAYKAGPMNYGDLNSTRRHVRLLLDYWIAHEKLAKSDAALIDDWLPIPSVAVFAGHTLDRPGRSPKRFPHELESAVRGSIRDWLLRNNVLIGFSSAASGSEILFQEVLQELGGESRIVLPYDHEQFARDSVCFAGDQWVQRYRNVLARATSVVTASQYRSQNDDIACDYANLVLHGLASVRTAELHDDQRAPLGLVLWNGKPGDNRRRMASVLRRWSVLEMHVDQISLVATDWAEAEAPERLPLISNPEPPEPVCQGAQPAETDTRIMAMLFGDAVNFSNLNEHQVSRFIQDFMGPIAKIVHSYGADNVVRNTWGDGLYLVFDNLSSAGLCALDVCDFVKSQIPDGWRQSRLPDDLNVRIALHAGPVFACEDPITGQKNYTGTHVSRAARLEPKTPPGEVYASEAFAALCVDAKITDFTCEYVKQLAWAKHYGTFPTFVLKRR
jgi:class 3 adenylate cyclase